MTGGFFIDFSSTSSHTNMDSILLLKALIMGIVEGLTEFLPISSTGHLILAGSLLNFTGDKVKVFEIAIQTGAMLAVCWEYRARIARVLSGLFSDRSAQKFALNIVVAFLPAAILGLMFSKIIKEKLFAPVPVALAFIIGGLIILWVERRNKMNPVAVRVESVDDMTVLDAFKVGCAQAFALIPGTSRSGASIIGGMMFGLSRKAATEFSFFLAIPTMVGAFGLDFWESRDLITNDVAGLIAIGFVVSFISGLFVVRFLVDFVGRYGFAPFSAWRILVGVVGLLAIWLA